MERKWLKVVVQLLIKRRGEMTYTINIHHLIMGTYGSKHHIEEDQQVKSLIVVYSFAHKINIHISTFEKLAKFVISHLEILFSIGLYEIILEQNCFR